MSLSVSDKSVFCVFHQSSEAFEIPFRRSMETNGSCTMTMCPVTGSLQSGGSCSKKPNSNHPPTTKFSRCYSMRLPALSENQDRAHRSSSCVCRRNSTKCNCRPHSHTKTGFPEGLNNNGQTTRAGVCVQKDSIWRVTRLDYKHILLSTNYAWGLGTLWSFHVQDGW